jgi:Mg2+ and Co2+ transporter CorA
MTGKKKTSDALELITKACAEITKCLEGSEQELPKGRIEQHKENVASAISDTTKTPALKKQLSEFEALCKKYASKMHSLYQARDLARWEHYTLKMDLCKEVKKLEKCADNDLPRIARELKLVRLRWKDIGSVPHEKSEEIWKEFCEQCDKLQNRISEYYNGMEENRKEIAVEKIKICEDAEKIQSSTDWEDDAQKFKDLQKRWRDVGFTAPDQEKELYMRFRTACDVFFDARKEYYHHAKFERENVSSVKFQLCEEAKTIFDLSYSEAHQLIPELWDRWKAAGSAGKSDRELYERFRGYFDSYYEGLRKQRTKNKKIKNKICDELQVLEESVQSGKKQFQDIKAEYSELKQQWDSTGAMPRSEEQAVIEKYFALSKKLDSFSSKSQHNDKDILKRSFELEKIVSAALNSLDSKKAEAWEKCQADWGALESAEKKYFRDSFDTITAAFVSDSEEHYEQLLNASNDNLKKRRKICRELENLGINPEKGATNEDLAEELTLAIAKNFGLGSTPKAPELKAKEIDQIAKRWLKAGTVPLKDLPQLYKRFEQALESAKILNLEE